MGLAPRNREGYFFPLDAEVRACHMDILDAALVLSQTLTQEGHAGQTYTVTGSESLSFHGMCEVLSKEAGRDFPCNYVSEEKAREVMLAGGLPDWLADVVLELFAIIRSGVVAEPLDGFERLTGREPTPIEHFARNNEGVLPQFA